MNFWSNKEELTKIIIKLIVIHSNLNRSKSRRYFCVRLKMDSDFVPFKDSESSRNSDIKLMTSSVAPWFGVPDYSASPLIRLHNEVLTFCEYITPSATEMKTRADLINDLTVLIKETYPTATCHVYGSQLTKIITPTSDLDLAILNVPVEDSAITALYKLESVIKPKNIASYLEVISSAKHPIIKMDHIASGISVDICVNDATGLETAKLTRKFVRGKI